MKTIIPESKLVTKILGNVVKDTTIEYRPINFLIEVKVTDGWLIRNQITFEMLLLDDIEYDEIFNKKNYSLEIVDDLIKKWFFVPVDFDESVLKQQFRNIIPLLQPNSTRRTYSILPTLDCNARCFYCFENDCKKISMTLETADKVVEYIEKTYNNSEILLRWFGGEPLYNSKIIDYICRKLIDKKINFISKMTTNGYLFDENMSKVSDLWNLKLVQITLDGTEKVYNRIKSYIYDTNESPFYRVLNNIQLLTDAKIPVSIRLNVERHNISDIHNLIDELAERFKGNKYISIYSAILFDDCGVSLKTRDEAEHEALLQENMRIKEKIFNLGFFKESLDKKPSINSCMADSDTTVIILPDGSLTRCERITERNKSGDIFGETPDISYLKSWKEIVDFEECKSCPIGLECMHLKKCPSWGHHGCGKNTQKSLIASKQFAMKNEYDLFLKNNND